MQAWSIEEWGLENLKLQEMESGPPGPSEVKVAFRAASLNYRDLLVVKGLYNPKFPRPLVPCSDGFGEIVEVGPAVPKSLLKKSVLTLFCPQWQGGQPQPEVLRNTLGGPLPGVLAQSQNFRVEEVLVLPEPTALTPGEWAALPCAGVTAWTCLVDHARLRSGQTVLLIGTGGVSLFGLQIAKMLGARCLLLSSSEAKRERALELGADAVSDYAENPEWSRWVLQETGGTGVDVVLETGGAGTLTQSLKSVKVGGHISLVGVLSGVEERLNILPLVMKAVTVRGAIVGHKESARELHEAILHNMIRPVIQQDFPWSEVPEAFQYLASGRQFGKITISFPEP
jgi:NADPH:quinone reductase-like Zn-dependent oxidoreductase